MSVTECNKSNQKPKALNTTSKLKVDIESLPTWANVDAKTPENHYLNDVLQDGFYYLID